MASEATQSSETSTAVGAQDSPIQTISQSTLFGSHTGGARVIKQVVSTDDLVADQFEAGSLENATTQSFKRVNPAAHTAQMSISELYDEIEPEYKRLTLGNLDFEKTDVQGLMTDWQSLKETGFSQNDTSTTSQPGAGTRIRGQLAEPEVEPAVSNVSPIVHQQETLQEAQNTITAPVIDSHCEPTSDSITQQHPRDDFIAPNVLVTSAKSRRPELRELGYDDRPDAAKLEDLKRFAYAHGSRGSGSRSNHKRNSQARNDAIAVQENNRGQGVGNVANNNTKSHVSVQPPASTNTASTDTVTPTDEDLSFHRASKVSKVLGLKHDRIGGITRSSSYRASERDFSDEDESSDEESLQTVSASTIRNAAAASSPVRRQVSFREAASASDPAISTDQTAKRALLIKAAHLEVCNHLTSTSRSKSGVKQANGWSIIGLTGHSFWDRLTELEKLKSQFTIIEIMRRYSLEVQFSDAHTDQVLMRDGTSGTSHEGAMSLDPKADLPLSTDLDNEVGRSKAAAEYIIERLSAKLASGTFHDDEDNIFKVPVKAKSPLSRIQSDSEWRLVQDAVSAHALGRGYQVQMGDGPEEITRPWQVRQKEHLKEAISSFTKWPGASELVWIKVLRLGIEN